jgi:hypothetical protein
VTSPTSTDPITTRYDSDWSDSVIITTAPDQTPPPAPSAAQTSRSGTTCRLRWDGLGAFGEAMPADIDAVEANFSVNAGYVPTTPAQRAVPGFDLSTDTYQADLKPGVPTVVAGLTSGITYYIILIARDKAGNRSGPSPTVSV